MCDKKSKELFKLAEFYQENLIPYTYTYKALFGIEIELIFSDNQFCHLIFGYVKDIPNAFSYKGKKGFDKIINLEITSPPPYKDIVDCGKLKGLKKTDIDADFLLYRDVDGKKIHLFLRWSDNDKKLVPCSLIKNNTDNYIEKQIKLQKLIIV